LEQYFELVLVKIIFLNPFRFSIHTRILPFCLALCFFIAFSIDLSAQKSKKQLEKEKKENLRKLQQNAEILKEVKKEKKVSLSQLSLLKQQAKLKERSINGIQEELGFIQSDIQNLQSEEQKLALNLVNIKKEYAAMIYAASKASVRDQLMFLFASETFNQFLLRLQYLRFYAKARRQQADKIREVSLSIVSKKVKLAEVKQGKEVLLTHEEQEKKQLENLKEDQKKVVNELAQREEDLKEKINNQKAAVARLERLISDLVKAAIKKSRVTVGPPNPKEDDEDIEQKMVLTPEGKLISKSFAGNKNRLAWPVQNGFISGGFGRHEHPVLKRIYVDNLGVDISTKVGEKVRSVFEGTVGLVGQVPGMDGQIIMVRHGEYFTVYSGLKNIMVSTGDKVKMKQVLGEVVKDDESGAVLQFQIWKNNRRMDPEDWLAKD
jgi:septal ring factor EnvC (AmiA/AmiB activator)